MSLSEYNPTDATTTADKTSMSSPSSSPSIPYHLELHHQATANRDAANRLALASALPPISSPSNPILSSPYTRSDPTNHPNLADTMVTSVQRARLELSRKYPYSSLLPPDDDFYRLPLDSYRVRHTMATLEREARDRQQQQQSDRGGEGSPSMSPQASYHRDPATESHQHQQQHQLTTNPFPYSSLPKGRVDHNNTAPATYASSLPPEMFRVRSHQEREKREPVTQQYERGGGVGGGGEPQLVDSVDGTPFPLSAHPPLSAPGAGPSTSTSLATISGAGGVGVGGGVDLSPTAQPQPINSAMLDNLMTYTSMFQARNEELAFDSNAVLEKHLQEFWTQQIRAAEDDTPRVARGEGNEKPSPTDWYKHPLLPLARIKKVMKSDPEVKMIGSEAPILFAKACEIFITEVTSRAWLVASQHKRRTLSRVYIARALAKSDQFDFLIDIVPRELASEKSRNGGGGHNRGRGGDDAEDDGALGGEGGEGEGDEEVDHDGDALGDEGDDA